MNDVSAGFAATEVARPRGTPGAPDARALSIAIMAMGGEGGGVLADWLVDLAEHAGWYAQTTSVPGVAQRTGATIYYVEIFPAQADAPADLQPVLALMPVPGEVDVVIASELMEAGRAVQRGLVSAERTTLIASTHRVYSMSEKIAMGDGRVDVAALIDAGEAAARRFVRADFAAIAERHQSVVSASLLGALAASGTLPFTRAQFEEAIRRAGVGVSTSLAAFAAGFDAATQGGRAAASSRRSVADTAGEIAAGAPASDTLVADTTAAEAIAADAADPLAAGTADPLAAGSPPIDRLVGPRLRPMADEVARSFPAAAVPTILTGLVRLADYQDIRYAASYVERLRRIAALPAGIRDPNARLLEETARGLALWMSYEDTIRVADLKIRRSRFARVRDEVRAGGTQVLAIREFLHPRVEEIADTLPAPVGRWLLRSGSARSLVTRFASKGRVVSTTSLRGYLMLYAVAALRPLRLRSLRYAVEHARIDDWLEQIARTAHADYALACEIAACQRLVKGYGETHERGTRNFATLMSALPRLLGRPDAARRLCALRDAALADEAGTALARELATLEQAGGRDAALRALAPQGR